MLELDRGGARPKSGPEIWVRRLKAKDTISVSICSPAIWEFWVHWAGDKSQPCLKPHKSCPGHRQGLPRRWKGYLFVVNHRSRRCEFLEITLGAVEQLNELVGEKTNLRGKRFTVARGNGDASRLSFASLPDWQLFSTAVLPEDVDPAKTLCKIWGIEDVSSSPSEQPAVSFGGEN